MIKQERKENIKECAYAIMLFCMLAPGLALDSVYWGKLKCRILFNILTWLKGFKGIGVTYQGALKVLGSNVGVLMTIVSLFLTMNINMAERSEKKVFGIYRKELFSHKESFLYEILKRMNYFAPACMIIF